MTQDGTNEQAKFMKEKRCLLQQGIEQLNESSDAELRKVLNESPIDPERVPLVLAEYLRGMKDVKKLYGTNQGVAHEFDS